jgi:uncharacterized protein YvpB
MNEVSKAELKKVIIDVPYINQSIKYPTGCESVSTVMLLNYLGYDITVDEFIDKYLEKNDFYENNGVLYGPDPRKCFCGSPYDPDSFGCYAPVICTALRNVLEGECRTADKTQVMGGCKTQKDIEPGVCGHDVIDETGTDMDRLLREYIDKGMPVIFWACIDMREPIVGPEWKLMATGETFTWISNEHCMLLVGYDDEGYYFNDPYENHGTIRYDRTVVEDRHKAQYSMAVGLREKVNVQMKSIKIKYVG